MSQYELEGTCTMYEITGLSVEIRTKDITAKEAIENVKRALREEIEMLIDEVIYDYEVDEKKSDFETECIKNSGTKVFLTNIAIVNVSPARLRRLAELLGEPVFSYIGQNGKINTYMIEVLDLWEKVK
jgi:enolase